MYADLEAIAPPAPRTAVKTRAMAGRVVSLAANALFLLGSVAVVLSRRVRLRPRADVHLLAVAGIGWITSVVQTLFEHGENPRFLVPLQKAVIYVMQIGHWAGWWKEGQAGRRAGATRAYPRLRSCRVLVSRLAGGEAGQ